MINPEEDAIIAGAQLLKTGKILGHVLKRLTKRFRMVGRPVYLLVNLLPNAMIKLLEIALKSSGNSKAIRVGHHDQQSTLCSVIRQQLAIKNRFDAWKLTGGYG